MVDIAKERLDHVINMCRYIAKKYKNHKEYEDCVSEALLVCLTLLDKDPKTHPAALYREANRVVYDYLNLKCHPVSIPTSDMARRLSRENDADVSQVDTTYSDSTVEQLRTVLNAVIVPVMEDTLSMAPSSEQIYERVELEDRLVKVVKDLSDEEQLFLYMRFIEDICVEECADFFGWTRRTGYRKQEALLSKIRDSVA